MLTPRNQEENTNNGKICVKIVGVGGAGRHVVDFLVGCDLYNVDFIEIDSAFESTGQREDVKRIVIGDGTHPKPLRSGTPGRAEKAVKNDEAAIQNVLEGTDLVLLLSGLGRDVGSGAAPEILRICRKIGAVSVAVVSGPYENEGKHRLARFKNSLPQIVKIADMVVNIPLERVRAMGPSAETQLGEFKFTNFVFGQAVKGILRLFNSNEKFLLDGDFEFTKQFLVSTGLAHMGFATSTTILDAMEKALSCPLFPERILQEAERLFVSLFCPPETLFSQIAEAMENLRKRTHPDADCFWGTSIGEGPPEVILYVFKHSAIETHSA